MTPHQLLSSISEHPNKLSLLIDTLNLFKKQNGFEQDLLTPGFIKEWLVSDILVVKKVELSSWTVFTRVTFIESKETMRSFLLCLTKTMVWNV